MSLINSIIHEHEYRFYLSSDPETTFKLHFCVKNAKILPYILNVISTGPGSAVGSVSCNRCKSDCRSSGHEFNPGPVPYFRGD